MFSNIQSSQEDNCYVFTSSAVGTGNKRVAWNKPSGIIGLNILCIGGGGSGGNGAVVGGASTKAGAGGGSSGTITSVSILSMFIPETLYITVGAGGAAPTSSNASGNVGTDTIVSIVENTTVDYYNIAIAFGGNGGVGTGGSGSTLGAGGAAVTIPTIANMPIASCGIYSMTAGQAGSSGGQLTVGGSSFTLQGSILSGGGGGGSASSAGVLYDPGSTSVNQNINDSIRLPVISSSQSLVDGNGTTLFKPIFCSFGGSGGWASDTGITYDGGNGGIGCGGGGGASSLTGFALGRGGRGGDGLVIISCW